MTHITAANYSGTATTAPLNYFLVPYGGYFCHEFVRVDSFYRGATMNFSQARLKVKFLLSKKATKVEEIFTFNLTLTT